MKMAAAVKHSKIKLREVNRHLVCRLCRGYYIDATTIAECLHSFCRSCIIKYLEKNSFCPVCEVQIHKTKPYLNLRLDKALQDVVYKLVPGLYHDEMKRRREFYAKNRVQMPTTTPEQCGMEERIIFSPDDSISLSLEYLENDEFERETTSSQSSESGDSTNNPESLSFPQQLGLMKLKSDGKTSRRESQDVPESGYPKRYLQCPAVVSVSHLKKFVRMKHDLTEKMQVDIVHKRVPLPDHYTLMDVAYIYTWKRSAPMRFFYQISETRRHRVKLPLSDVDDLKTELVNGTGVRSDVSDAVVPRPADEPTSREGTRTQVEANGPVAGVKPDAANGLGPRPVPVAGPVKTNGEPAKAVPEPVRVGDGQVARLDGKVDGSKEPRQNGLANGFPAKSQPSPAKADRLLLNPISGQLESVPSATSQAKSASASAAVNGQGTRVEKTKCDGHLAGDSAKKPAADAKARRVSQCQPQQPQVQQQQQKPPPQQQQQPQGVLTPVTDAAKENARKSSVNLLKSFRKDKSTSNRKDGKNGSERVSGGNAVTITAVGKTDKKDDKSGVSVEIKCEKKDSEYDFDGTSPPTKIMSLQEYSKMSKYQKYLSVGGNVKQTPQKQVQQQQQQQQQPQAQQQQQQVQQPKPQSQPQNSWMSLQDFRMHMLKENSGSQADDNGKKDKRKSVPSLFRIGTEAGKKGSSPTTTTTTAATTPNGKTSPTTTTAASDPPRKVSPTIINIKTESEDNSRTEINIELPADEPDAPPKPIKIENKGGEYSIKGRVGDDQTKKATTTTQVDKNLSKQQKEPQPQSQQQQKKAEEAKAKSNGSNDAVKVPAKKPHPVEKVDGDSAKKRKTSEDGQKSNFGAMDLSKSESSPRPSGKTLETLMADLANHKSGPGLTATKSDETMVEALISAAQKQSIEPLLKIPQFGNGGQKGSPGREESSPPSGTKNISSTDISQALQFFKDLRSDIKVLEAKSQSLSPNGVADQTTPKSGSNLEPIQLYQQHIDMIRKLKRQQLAGSESDAAGQAAAATTPPPRKQPKLSPQPPLSDPAKKKVSPKGSPPSTGADEAAAAAHLKSSLERMLFQIQDQMELQSRMAVAQAYKNLPPLLQFYNHPTAAFCPSPPSPSKSGQPRLKSSSHSPPSCRKSPTACRKSPQSLSSSPSPSSLALGPLPTPADASFFASQKFNSFVNAGLTPEMTFHQSFQNYLKQQEKINKMSQTMGKKSTPGLNYAKTISDLYYGALGAKAQEPGTIGGGAAAAAAAVQKT